MVAAGAAASIRPGRRLALVIAAAGLGGCGLLELGTPEPAPRDAPASIDAAVIDAAVIDAAVRDAPMNDCCVPLVTYAGSIYVFEAKVLDPGPGATFFGQGIQAEIGFVSSDAWLFPPPILEEQPGSPLGCKAWSYTPAQRAAALGLDEGRVEINSPAATGLLPACGFEAGRGYVCPEVATYGAGGAIAAGVGPLAGRALLTDPAVTFTAATTSDRYVRITGATSAANNGEFPIVGLVDAHTIAYHHPAFVAETIPAAGDHVNLAGVGPIPGAADPGFLADAAPLQVVHTAGGGGHVDGFATTMIATGSVGDGFTLAPAELAKLNAIPRDGAAFTLTCSPADCPSGSATGTFLHLVTTDGATGGRSPFAMPAPASRQVEIRCAALGVNAITVPTAYAGLIMTSGATRIRTTLLRPTLVGGGPPNVRVVAGHAIVGYSN